MQSHITLINPRYRVWSPSKWVPLGLGYIAAVLEKEGYAVEIIDLSMEKVNDRQLRRRVENADIVGITGIITEFQEVLRIAKLVKEARGNIKVILGGPLATTLPRELLGASRADFIVIGEGERTIVSLLSAINQNSDFANIKGIAYRDDGGIIVTGQPDHIADLDSIPFPSRHLLDMNRYLQNHFENVGVKIRGFGKIRSTNLITTRGCPFNCTFCFKDMWGPKWRARSPANIVEEVELLHRSYGVNGFFFNDDTFVLDSERVLKFCQLLKSKGLRVVWDCNGRVNLMTKDLLEAMYDAGCRGIAYGIESGNQRILDSIKKKITLEEIRKVVKWTRDAGIRVTGYFMLGLIGETKADIQQTLAFARELDLDHYGFSTVTPLPGTELYDTAAARGLIPGDLTTLNDWTFEANVNLTEDCSNEELAAFENRAFRELVLKGFGKYYMLKPAFLKKAARVALSLRSKKEVKELASIARRNLRSYWQKV